MKGVAGETAGHDQPDTLLSDQPRTKTLANHKSNKTQRAPVTSQPHYVQRRQGDFLGLHFKKLKTSICEHISNGLN